MHNFNSETWDVEKKKMHQNQKSYRLEFWTAVRPVCYNEGSDSVFNKIYNVLHENMPSG